MVAFNIRTQISIAISAVYEAWSIIVWCTQAGLY